MRFILDVTMRSEDGALQIELLRRTDAFTPPQQALELRLPPTFRTLEVDGTAIEMQRRAVASGDRSMTFASARIPLHAKGIRCEW